MFVLLLGRGRSPPLVSTGAERMTTRRIVAVLVTLGVGGAALAGRQGEAPVAEQAARAGEAAQIETVGDLLDALETADAGIDTFQARVMYDRIMRLQGDRIVRIGGLAFRVDEPAKDGNPARRTFSVLFDQTFVGNVLRTEPRHMVFDGEWLVEKNDADKTFVARQVTRPGEPIDPLRLGEGPMPLPIGQRKEDILSRFDAELLAPTDGIGAPEGADEEELAKAARREAFVENTYQLHMVPHERTARDLGLADVRLWYEKGTLYPRLARTVTPAGDVSWVQLIGIKVNEALPASAMTVVRPLEEDGWQIDVIEYREGVEDKAEERAGEKGDAE